MILRALAAVLAGVVLASCRVVPRRGSPRVYQDFSTNSAACTKNPAGCAAMHGVAAESGSAAQAIGTGLGLATVIVGAGLDGATRSKIDEVVKHCADMARAEVILRHFGNRSPTPDDCNELVSVPGRGQIQREMQLGNEMHRVAFDCVNEKLSKLIPGRFSIEQRYRYDARTRMTTVMSPEEEAAILRDRRHSDLRGTIVPDLVVHNGNPRYVQDVYDFKFRCVNSDRPPEWRPYPAGHPFAGKTQGDVYLMLLGHSPAAVVPILGIFR